VERLAKTFLGRYWLKLTIEFYPRHKNKKNSAAVQQKYCLNTILSKSELFSPVKLNIDPGLYNGLFSS